MNYWWLWLFQFLVKRISYLKKVWGLIALLTLLCEEKYSNSNSVNHLPIWTNAFSNLDKYILEFGQIYFSYWTDIFCALDKYNWPPGKVSGTYQLAELLLCGEIFNSNSVNCSAIWTNTFGNLDKYIWQFGQIYLVVQRNVQF